MSIATSCCFCYDHIKHCPSASFITGVCVQTSKQQYRTSTSKYTHTMSPHSETPVTATMSGAKFSRRYEETFFYVEVIKFGKKIKCVHLKIPRLDSSDLMIAQWLERQTSIHEVVGSSPTRRSNFSNLNIYITLLVPVPKGCSPIPSQKNTTHTHTRTHTHTHTHTYRRSF